MRLAMSAIKLIESQTGDEEDSKTKSDSFCPCSPMTLALHFRYISLLNMVLRPVGNILGSGSDHLPPQDVYSRS